MTTVKIGNEERPLETADPQWINQQISARRAAGESVCVVVHVNCPGADLILRTPTCGGRRTGSGGRAPNDLEKRIFDLWDERGLNEVRFTSGSVVAFLKQLESLCG